MVGFGGGCDGIYFTHAVGLLPAGASPYGVYDMAGNVSEWVADWYSETYYGESSYDNPIGPSSGVYRVLRGGSFEGIRYSVKTFYRNWIDPTNNNANLGFRCAMDAEP